MRYLAKIELSLSLSLANAALQPERCSQLRRPAALIVAAQRLQPLQYQASGTAVAAPQVLAPS
jgi:hypothetical protein